jgi:hypothetical protein
MLLRDVTRHLLERALTVRADAIFHPALEPLELLLSLSLIKQKVIYLAASLGCSPSLIF